MQLYASCFIGSASEFFPAAKAISFPQIPMISSIDIGRCAGEVFVRADRFQSTFLPNLFLIWK